MNKNIFIALTSSIVAVTVIGASPLKSQALTLDFTFDNTPNGTVTDPIVGTGTFSFDGDIVDGTVALTSLANFDFSFNFVNGSSFTNTDISTPLANVLVNIATIGSDRFVKFGGLRGGRFGGSIDFFNASNFLTFEPNFGSLYGSNNYFGTYLGIFQVLKISFSLHSEKA
jgi:hypothetical protein